MENGKSFSLGPLLSSARRVAQLAPSPRRPSRPLAPPRVALCPLLSGLYNERGQGSASDTPGSHFRIATRIRSFSDNCLRAAALTAGLAAHFLESRRSQRGSTGQFSFTPVLSVDPAAVISRNRVPEARIDLSKLSLTNRSVVKQERPER
jgi:hypothetical protein